MHCKTRRAFGLYALAQFEFVFIYHLMNILSQLLIYMRVTNEHTTIRGLKRCLGEGNWTALLETEWSVVKTKLNLPTTPQILYRIPCVLHGEKNPFPVEIDETLTVGIGKAHQGISFEFFVINPRCTASTPRLSRRELQTSSPGGSTPFMSYRRF